MDESPPGTVASVRRSERSCEAGVRLDSGSSKVSVIDVAPGLWIWRLRHPRWTPDQDWQPEVACTCVHSGFETLVLDPLRPPEGATEVWARLSEHRPTSAVILKPDHVRDVDWFVERYQIRAFGPSLFWRDDIPNTELEPIEPGTQLPGGLVALYDGRGKNETPVWLPEQKTVVFADALTTQGDGKLRVWSTPWHEERTLPALRKLLELPLEQVIISHGEPVHSRAEFEKALTRQPFES
jgi:glyoxylase-like metal-dependent hydrolase (beta-lactamase superfamily II)